MRARLVPILVAVLAAGCTSQTDRELEAVKSARSVLAEWALVEGQAGAGRTPATYLEQVRRQSRTQLETAQAELSRQPQAAALLAQLQEGLPGATGLKRARAALEPLEKPLDSS
jgi:hypothetical protein